MTEYQVFKLLAKEGNICLATKTEADFYYQRLLNKGLDLTIKNEYLSLNYPITALDKTKIKAIIKPQFQFIIDNLDIVYETDSTSRLISSKKNSAILLAEYQSSGKGRTGKSWLSPVGHNIYLSIKYQNILNSNLSFLPLYISLQLAKALNVAGIVGISIKWPNDLYLNNIKFSGTLIEVSGSDIILGLGINVTMPQSYHTKIDQPYTSISNFFYGKLIDRNFLLASIMPELYNLVDKFDPKLIDHYLLDYEKYDLLRGKTLLVFENNKKYTADYNRINLDGSLRVKVNNGYKDIYSADVSIRLKPHD